MNIFAILFLLFVIPVIALLAWFALSSCLGDNVRAAITGARLNPRHGAYGRSYARGLGSGMGQATSESIEMEDVLRQNWDEQDSDYEH